MPNRRKNTNDPHIRVNLRISKSLLEKIEQNVEGKNRSQKIVKTVAQGYEILVGERGSTSIPPTPIIQR
jgi:hypothetical protein